LSDFTEMLADSQLDQANRVLRLEPPLLNAFREAAAIVRADDELRQLAADCRDIVIGASGGDTPRVAETLEATLRHYSHTIDAAMGERGGMFPALLVPLLLPWTIRRYLEQRLQDTVLVDTMSDVTVWMTHYYGKYGVWGIDQFGWLLRHLRGELFRLGRLQFVRDTFRHAVIVLRHRCSGETAALSEAGVVYRADGKVNGTNGIDDAANKWTARYEANADSYVGNPILSAGVASGETIRLPAADWRIALRRGDPVLDVHIAEGSKLTPKECRESLRQAAAFYQAFDPPQPFRAFVCASWLLDPQFGAILPPSSNIVAFQRLFYLFPLLSDESETYLRVFGSRTIDPAKADRGSTLRRAVADYAAAGNLLHGAGGLLLAEDGDAGVKPAF